MYSGWISPSRHQLHVILLRTTLTLVLLSVCWIDGTSTEEPWQPIEPDSSFQAIVIPQAINKLSTERVNNSVEFIYQFSFREILKRSTSDVRVHVTTEDGIDPEHPVLFVVRQQKDVVSWQLPQRSKFDPGKMYSRASRTLCSEINNLPNATTTNGYRDVENLITVTISTSSAINVTFTINVTVEDNFILRLGEGYQTHVAPPSPRFYRFLFPKFYEQYVLLEVTSNDTICMTVSVQNSTCPVFDDESNVQFSGYWQTTTTKAGMTIRSDEFPNGFYVAFVVHTDDSRCTKNEPGSNYKLSSFGEFNERRKIIDFKIVEKISKTEYIMAIFGTFGFFMLFYIFSIIISCIYYFKVRPPEFPIEDTLNNGDGVDAEEIAGSQTHAILHNDADNNINNRNLQASEYTETENSRDPEQVQQIPHHSRSLSWRQRPQKQSAVDSSLNSSHWLAGSDSSLDETDIDFMDDVNRLKDIFRTTGALCVSALARKNPTILAKKSQLYLWTLLTVAVFYALPVVQLVFTYQRVLHTTGNQDLCYYNYLCSHPLWLLSDFNHVFSNVGYIMLGFLFIFLVYRKDRVHQKLELQTGFVQQPCGVGIPCHYGLFYTMGSALCLEGVLSACYHVCPNGSNFQFDTSFMYVIAVMCMLKIYQTRHPDINASAYLAFASLAFVILIGVIGVLASSIYFWVCFTTLHVTFCLFLTVQIYYLGRWRLDLGLFSRIYMTWRNDCLASPLSCLSPLYLDRFVFLTLANLVNWSVAALGIIGIPDVIPAMSKDFATHLLFIFMSNLFLYTIFYIVMKLTHREKIYVQPALYIVLSTLFWTLAAFAFLQKSTSWQLTPSQSRQFNQECFILRFFDFHDIWHFLSASAMFFSFMMYLTLDDDLVATPRNRIPVF